MKRDSVLLLKIVLTLLVAYALAYPFLYSTGGGVFSDVERLGVYGSLALASGFLTLIFLYCRDLERTLSMVRPSARKASPKSVWFMFLLPYNFVEDFFIVANVAGSLRQEAQHSAVLQTFKGFGLWSGLGWCAAQIVSLLPHELGSIAGVAALPLWIVHWRLVRRVNAVLATADRVRSGT